MKISLVILTCNEKIGISTLYDRIPFHQVDEVFAVDWNSTDGTVEFLKSKGIRVFSQEIRGRGEAFRLAFKNAIGDALVFFGPDGNEMPEDIPKFRPFLEKGFDIVVGNRMSRGGRNEEDDQFLKIRKWANQGFTLFANVLWNKGPYINDTINGFRCVRKDAWEKISPDGQGYTIEYQSTIRAFKKRLKIAEFPTVEGNRIEDRPGSPGIPTGIAFLKVLAREWV